jgi:hypothetical protein
MIERKYQKEVNSDRLNLEIIAAGLPVYPNTGARFYGILGKQFPTYWECTVLLFDDITQNEIATVDAVVAAHIPIPMPQEPTAVTISGTSLDPSGKLYTRAESRPLDCTTCFTTCGDTDGANPVIGAGPRLAWDASSVGWVDDENGAPDGMKQISVTIQFCDSIWLKEGTIYYMDCDKGSYIDMEVLCPNGGYYMYLGQVYQNTTGNDLAVDHYLFRHPMQDNVPMGDELNTETCSQELPSYLKFKLTVTVPEADVTSYGYMEVELYRRRTVVIG